ncbi:hypothetical protein F4802DRAFT_378146 [Xylaria palmicola]|nr:hypothetical protein F4802DRAFT_378146 [Xylaria palmicola]
MSQEFDLGVRLQALTLHSIGYTRAKIIEETGYSAGGLCGLLAKARKRGYKPGGGPILREYVETEPRKGRPPKLTPDRTSKIVAVLTSDKACRKFSSQKLADKINKENPNDPPLSRRTVLRALTAKGLKPIRHTKRGSSSGS